MAHSLSAKKRIRQNVKCRARNRWRKTQVKEAIRSFEEALAGGQIDKAEAELKIVYQKLDRVACAGTIHKNAADRKKSRLTKRLNAAR